MGCVNCDSQYKFMGPHQGVLYGKYDLLDRLRAYKVRPAPAEPPGKYETGTQNPADVVCPRGSRGRWRR
jgi:selenocysteine lyase/cysteine desulfurase